MGAVTRPFRFGVQAYAPMSGPTWMETARRAESAGYSTLLISDHVYYKQLAPLTALMAAAMATERLRVGTLVLANDFRHPALLAAELATIDRLSGGRLEVGIGAGWANNDYKQLGLPMDAAGRRIERLAEALDVIRQCWSGEKFSFDGANYVIDGLTGAPRPWQRPHPPLLIGGGGRKMLTLAAAQADIVGINGVLSAGAAAGEVMDSMTARRFSERIAMLDDQPRGAEVERNVNVYFQAFGPDRDAAVERLSQHTGLSAEEVLESPYVLAGTAEQMVEDLRVRRERWGISYFVVQETHLDAFAPVVAELSGT